jgi:hypothetical protein
MAEALLVRQACLHRCSAVFVQVILHPKWGSSVYPASLFAKAPLEVLTAAIDEAVAALAGRLTQHRGGCPCCNPNLPRHRVLMQK